MADVVEHFEVSGDWRHIIEDGMVDLDALPDEVRPTGHVEFTPVRPGVSVAGSPARAYTLGTDTGLIADGVLVDMQGRDGVRLAGRIGDVVVRWRAVVHLEYRDQMIPYPDVEFDLSGPVRLTGLIRNDMPGSPPWIVDPRIEAVAARLDEADQIVAAVAGYVQDARDQVPLAKAEADRAIGLANAQDVHVAGVLADPDSATHAAFNAVGNATYGPRLPWTIGDDTADMNAALAESAGTTVHGLPGADYDISGTLIIPSDTTVDLGGATVSLATGADKMMVRNTSYNTALGGVRDKAITLRNGTLDKGANAGLRNDTHGMVFGSVDQLTLERLTYYSDPVTLSKYGILVQDVSDVLIQHINFPLKTRSDGIHIIGPARRVVVRDIYGVTGDDFVAITASDYPAYNPSNWPSGGDVAEVLYENLFMTPGSHGSVKVLAGPGRRVDSVTIRNVKGDTDTTGVNFFSDHTFPETIGGTIGTALVEDVEVRTEGGYMLYCNVDVDGVLEARSLVVKDPVTRPVLLTGVGTTIRRAVISGVAHINASGTPTVTVAGSVTVDSLTVRDVERATTGISGGAVWVEGTAVVKRLVVDNVTTKGGDILVYIAPDARVDVLVIRNCRAPDVHALVRNNSFHPVQVFIEGASPTTAPLVRASGPGGVDLRAGNLASPAIALYGGEGTQRTRVAGNVMVDAAAAGGPREGDRIINTNPAVLPLGPALMAGGVWRSDVDGTTYSPPAFTLVHDTFARNGEIVGTPPDTIRSGSVWTGTVGAWRADGSDMVPVTTSNQAIYLDPRHNGRRTLSGIITADTTVAAVRATRLFIGGKSVEGTATGARLQFTLTASATITFGQVVAGAYAGNVLPAGAIPSNTPGLDYPFSLTLAGDQLTATVAGTTATYTLTPAAVAAIGTNQMIALQTSDPLVKVRELKVTAP